MEVTNISTDYHRFVPPWARDRRYIWAPGETLDVPENVAQEVLSAHRGVKLIEGRPEPYETEELTYEDRQMRPRRGRPPKER
jgi:hypothetical protein